MDPVRSLGHGFNMSQKYMHIAQKSITNLNTQSSLTETCF